MPAKLFQMFRTGFQSIIDSYKKILEAGAKVHSFTHNGFWEDLGTPQDYFAAHEALFNNPDRLGLCSRLGLDPSTIYWDDTQRSAYCGFAAWESAELSNSFIMAPSSGKVTIQSSLVYPGVEFLSDQTIKHSLVMPGLVMDLSH